MIVTGVSLVSSCRVRSRAARVLNRPRKRFRRLSALIGWPEEEPRKTQFAVGMCCGQVVAGLFGELAPGLVERRRECNGQVAEAHGDQLVGDRDVVLG
jgi:hypothetical protein